MRGLTPLLVQDIPLWKQWKGRSFLDLPFFCDIQGLQVGSRCCGRDWAEPENEHHVESHRRAGPSRCAQFGSPVNQGPKCARIHELSDATKEVEAKIADELEKRRKSSALTKDLKEKLALLKGTGKIESSRPAPILSASSSGRVKSTPLRGGNLTCAAK